MNMQEISDCLSQEAQHVAEARLAAKRAARAEAREIRMKELERQQKEVEERSDKEFSDKGSRPVSSLSAATLASLGGTSSRRGSGDTSISVDTEASIREIKDSLAEVEEKYKRSMVTNAQLDNEKSSLQYQVDTLRDVLLELEEELAESRRQYEDKHKECERQKHDQNVLRFQLAELKDALEQREQLLSKHGIALDLEETPNGDASLDPHIIEDCYMESPPKESALGKSGQSNVSDKEMSVMGQAALHEHEQESMQAQEKATRPEQGREETHEKATEEDLQETTTGFHDGNEHNGDNSTELKQAFLVENCCNKTTSEQCLGQPEDGINPIPLCMISEGAGNTIEYGVNAVAETELKQPFSELDGNTIPSQRNMCSSVNEVFQDALDFIIQIPNPVDEGFKERNFSESNVKNEGDIQRVESVEDHQASTEISTYSQLTSEGCEKLCGTVDDLFLSGNVAPDETADVKTNSASEVFCECATGDNTEMDRDQGHDNVIEKLNQKMENMAFSEYSQPIESEQKEDLKTQVRVENTDKEIPVLKNTEGMVDVKTEESGPSPDVEETNENLKENIDENRVYSVQHFLHEMVYSEKDGETSEVCISNTEGLDTNCGSSTEHRNLNVDIAGLELNTVAKKVDQKKDDIPTTGSECKLDCEIEPENSLLGEQRALNEVTEKVTPNDNKNQSNETHSETSCREITPDLKQNDPEEENHEEVIDHDTENESPDDEEETGQNEKYEGESERAALKMGSSVDRSSSREDVRSEDSTNKSVKMGKGKNKEDCVIS